MRPIYAVLAATVWISINEFLRNQVLLIDHWKAHYEALGLTFPQEPHNGALWGVWALCFATVLLVVSRRFDFVATLGLGWSFGFLLMWIVVGNLGMLPLGVLPYAVPWSVVEVAGAVWLVKKWGQ